MPLGGPRGIITQAPVTDIHRILRGVVQFHPVRKFVKILKISCNLCIKSKPTTKQNRVNNAPAWFCISNEITPLLARTKNRRSGIGKDKGGIDTECGRKLKFVISWINHGIVSLYSQHVLAGNKVRSCHTYIEILRRIGRTGIVCRLMRVAEMARWPHVGAGNFNTIEISNKAVIIIDLEDQFPRTVNQIRFNGELRTDVK